MDAAVAGGALGLSAVIAVVVALVKGLWSGDMPPRAVLATVILATIGLLAVAVASDVVSGTPFDLLVRGIMQAGLSIGLREGTVQIMPQVSTLPSR